MKRIMKKLLAVGLLSSMLLLCTGCGTITDVLNGVTEGASDSPPKLYWDLTQMMNNPTDLDRSTYRDYVQKEITYTAMILSDMETLEFDDSNVGPQKYVTGTIARSSSDIFLLNIEELETPPVAGDIVEITGKIKGHIYYVENGANVEVLDVIAKKVDIKQPEDKPSLENKISHEGLYDKGTFVFKKAQATRGPFDEVALLYFEYTNEYEKETKAPLQNLTFYQGDVYLTALNFDVEAEIDPKALEHFAISNETYPNKTSLYYVALGSNDSELTLTDEPIMAYYFDDDYNCKNQVEITLEK